MKRYTFIDWYRGLACLLMFQTHAYDSWLAPRYQHGWFWEISNHQLGGLPSRLFLFLAGVSLMLRYDSDFRRCVPLALARGRAARRGWEVVGLGYAFRVFEWLMDGAHLRVLRDLLRVDILTCIGLSLVISAYVASPRDLDPRRPPLPWRPALLTLAIVMLTPAIEPLWAALPAWMPRALTSYVAGQRPIAFFPLLPWLAYVLSGCVVGAVWIRQRERLPAVMGWTTALGAALSLLGQLAYRARFQMFRAPDGSIVTSSPTVYLYRIGLILLLAGLSYAAVERLQQDRFSALRTLGMTSLFAYWIHVELVYGHASDLFKHRLHPVTATLLLLLLCWLMVALCRWRLARRASAA